MENDKKKKKNNNKKKKNKQQQQAKVVAEDTSSNAGETSSQDHNHVEERSHSNQAPVIINAGLDDWSSPIVDGIGGHSNSNGILNTILADTEKQKWLQEEARLREVVKQLLYEKDSYVLSQAELELRMKQLQCENDSWRQKETILADTEKQKWLQEEARLREMVKQLLYEKDSCLQSQADLESRMKQLQCENDSWHQKEVSQEQRISHLIQEKADVSLEEVNLREKIRHIEKEKFLLVENENSSKELIATLSNENTKLRMQVLDLEGAQNSLSEENRQFLDNISTLESRIQDLEKSLTSAISAMGGQKDGSEKEDLGAQIEAAFQLVDKLVTENAELVEKLNELYMELESHRVAPEVTSVEVSDDVRIFETVPIGDERVVSNDLDSDYANVVRHSSETNVSGEIVQIPLLDENEVQDLEAQASPMERDDEDVPITDAPLIGAPFRLISFVAKYVSGADLVNGTSSNSLTNH